MLQGPVSSHRAPTPQQLHSSELPPLVVLEATHACAWRRRAGGVFTSTYLELRDHSCSRCCSACCSLVRGCLLLVVVEGVEKALTNRIRDIFE